MSKLTLRQQIKALELVIGDTFGKDSFVTRKYIIEKLQRILEGTMNFHPKIIKIVKEEINGG